MTTGNGKSASPMSALQGIRVIDLTQMLFGPLSTQFLGDFGADVIKIERPGVGDLMRRTTLAPPDTNNPLFQSVNRNKRSLELDLQSESGRTALGALLVNADVVVSNFRPGTMERLGFGFERLQEQNPRLIYAIGSGFGSRGPYAAKPAIDPLIQAMTGVVSLGTDAGPGLYGSPVADYTAGILLALGVLVALRARELTGLGQKVDVSLFDALLSMHIQEATMLLTAQRELNYAGVPLRGVFQTKDGSIVLAGGFPDNRLPQICEALEIEDLTRREQFVDLEACAAHRGELHGILADRFTTETSDHWLRILEAKGVMAARVETLASALAGETVAANRMVWRSRRDDGGELATLANPIGLSATPARLTRLPPTLGQHSHEVLG